jgi:dolichol-phosphate mannosyltransferase
MRTVLVFTPTYNEADNIAALVEEVLASLPRCHLLVVDDNSPDGTGRILEDLKVKHPRLLVIHRPGKQGLGTAHKLAIEYAMLHAYEALVTMDADFSHDPKCLPRMLRELEHADFVIGSRYVPGGSCEYPPSRVFLSRTANLLTRGLLGIPLHETTTSYRGFRRSLLERLNVDSLRADGYAYLFESVYQISRLARSNGGHRMAEFPIRFADRRAGITKLSTKELWKSITTLARLAADRAVRSRLPRPRADAPKETTTPSRSDEAID